MSEVAVMVFTVVYFVVLMVVALEPHDPERRGRHRRGRIEGAQ